MQIKHPDPLPNRDHRLTLTMAQIHSKENVDFARLRRYQYSFPVLVLFIVGLEWWAIYVAQYGFNGTLRSDAPFVGALLVILTGATAILSVRGHARSLTDTAIQHGYGMLLFLLFAAWMLNGLAIVAALLGALRTVGWMGDARWIFWAALGCAVLPAATRVIVEVFRGENSRTTSQRGLPSCIRAAFASLHANYGWGEAAKAVRRARQKFVEQNAE